MTEVRLQSLSSKALILTDANTEMSNRVAFIDFVRGLLMINPLERWSPQQAKLHPFITQQKFTGPFVPPMNLKSSSLNRSPAPGTQQQQQAEALSKQRAQQAQAHASTATQGAYASMPAAGQYQAGHPQGPPVYANNNAMYSPNTGGHSAAPPPYGTGPDPYGRMVIPPAPQQMGSSQYGNVPQQQGGLYPQGNMRNRQRASTMEQQQSGIPAAIQRVASHLDPSQPIRLQPSPAYYPPGPDGMAGLESTPGRAGRRDSRAQRGGRGNVGRDNSNFIRNLEERTLEEGYNQNPWH